MFGFREKAITSLIITLLVTSLLPVLSVRAQLSIVASPTSGLPGDRIFVQGNGFTEIADVTISLDSIVVVATGEVETDDGGSFATVFKVPSLDYGEYLLTSIDEYNVSATTHFTIGPCIAFNVDYGTVGQVITVYGRGFTAMETVDSIMIDETPCIIIDTIGIEADREFKGQFLIPSVLVGEYTINVTDTNDLFATAGFEVTAKIEVDPNRGLPGEVIGVHGYNFAESTDVYIELWDKELTWKIADLLIIKTDSNGEFNGAFVTPVVPYRSYAIVAQQPDYTETYAGFRIGEPISAWATVIPDIDGLFSPGEWDDADYRLRTTPEGDEIKYFVKNDANNLYIAVRITDDDLSIGPEYADEVLIFFDNDHDHNREYLEVGDDIIGWTGYSGEGYRDGYSDYTWTWLSDESDEGTNDGEAAATHRGLYNYFEFSHPIDSADDDHDFSLSTGDTVGVAGKIVKNSDPRGWIPDSNPAFWGDILISDHPTAFEVKSSWLRNAVILDGVISSPDEWAEAITHIIPLDLVYGWPDRQVEPSDRVLEARFKNDNEWLYCLYKFELQPEEEINGALIELFTWYYDPPPDYESDLGGVRTDSSTIDLVGWTGSEWELDTDLDPPGDNDVEGATYREGDSLWFEFRKRLDSGDGYDWLLNPGELVGEPDDPLRDEHLLVGVWDLEPHQNFEHRIEMQLAGPRAPPDGLVSWWTGDGNTFDLVGSNHGAGKNGVTYDTGMVDQAFSFDGKDDYVYAPGTGIDELQQLTIEAWVKLDSMPDRQERFITLMGEKAVLRYDGENNPGGRQLHFYMFFEEPIIQRHIRVNNVLQLGVFHHVAGTYDGDYMRLYLDGVEIETRAVSGEVIQGNGVIFSSSLETLDGLLDEVCIYNRALSADEMQAIYEAGPYGKYKSLPEVALAKPADKGQPDEGAAPEYLNYTIPIDTPIPVQVIWEPDLTDDNKWDLVLGKPTAVLVNVSDVIDYVYVEVEFDGQLIGDYKYSTDLHPTLVLYPFIPETTGDKTFILRYDGNYVNEKVVEIVETSPLNVSYCYLYRTGRREYGTVDLENWNWMVGNSTAFMNATYPIADMNVAEDWTGLPGNESISTPEFYGIYLDVVAAVWDAKLRLDSSAIGIAIGPNNPDTRTDYFKYHGIPGAAAICFGPSTKGLVTLDGYYTGAAHEIGHIFYLYYGPGVQEQYEEVSPFGKDASGFWVMDDSWRSGYCFMGVGNYRNLDQTWVHDSTYEDLFNTLKTPSSGSPILLANGVIFDDGTFERTLPYYVVQGTADRLIPGDYSLVFRDIDDNILREVSFAAPKYVYVEPAIGHVGYSAEFGWKETTFGTFAFATEYPPATYKVQIMDNTVPQSPVELDVVYSNDIKSHAHANGPYTAEEGTPVTFDASGSLDLDSDSLQYRWDVDGDGTWDTGWSTDPTTTHIWYDDWTGTAIVEVKDGELFDTDIATVTILNVNPAVGDITAPSDPVAVGTLFTASAEFADPGTLDTHVAVWDWGDGTASEKAVVLGERSVSGDHEYSTPGVYTINLTVTDDDDGFGISTFQYVVVYDPSIGFVTGGGWINSPAGAYTLDPELMGKATFGFVSKYKKGANEPTGKTEFVFHIANLNFNSDVYQWLVIAGPRAKFKGTGTINGKGEYGFMLTAIDGQIQGGQDTDKFRIKIWEIDGSVVYDNQLGDADDADATMELGGGSIVIHKK